MRLILTILLLVSPTAFADFNGNWTGSGTLKAAPESTPDDSVLLDCGTVEVDIKQTNAAILFKTVSYSCTSPTVAMDVSYLETNLQISGTDLIFEGGKVGEISASKITLVYNDPTTDFHSVRTFELTSTGVIFSDRDSRISDDKVFWDFASDLTLSTTP